MITNIWQKYDLLRLRLSDHSTHQARAPGMTHDDVDDDDWCGLEFEFIKNKKTKFIIPYIYCIQKVIFTPYA